MLKKALFGGAVLLIGSWALSMTDVGSYVKTFVRDTFASAKKSVPIDFEIKVAEEELSKLDQVDDRLISQIAAEMVAEETKKRELDEMSTNLAKKKEDIRQRVAALKVDKPDGQQRFYIDNRQVSRGVFELELDKANKSYRIAEGVVDNTRKILAETQTRLAQAKEQRDGLKSTKASLEERIQKLKTEFEILKVAEMKSKRANGDGSVAELERLKSRIDGLEARIHQRIIENQLRESPAKTEASARSSVEILQEAERIGGDEADKK